MKAQTEIVGILVIVIIITIAMLFYVTYAVNSAEEEGDDSIRKEFVDNELSISFVKSLAEVSVEECNAQFDDIVKDCGLYNEFGRLDCVDGNSCDYVRTILDSVAQDTLVKWDRSYDLRVDFGDQSGLAPIVSQTEDCDIGTIGRRAPGVIFVPYYPNPGQARIELAVCKS